VSASRRNNPGYAYDCEVSAGLFPGPFSSRSWRHLFWRGWITETQPSLAFRCTIYSSDFSRWWTLLLGWCFRRRGTTLSVHSSVNCTGWR